MADGPWTVAIKTGEFPRRLDEIIRKKGNPAFLWRETLLTDVYPDAPPKKIRGNQYVYRPDGSQARVYRRMITVCMSDPDVMGYVRDGGNTHNPRYRRVEK